MRTAVARCRAFLRSPLGIKLYRYFMGSVITTVVSFVVLTLVYGVLRLWGAVPSTVFANVVATVPAYWLNRTWTWGKSGRSDVWREVVPFWVLSILGIVISMGTAAGAADLARSHHLGHLSAIALVDGANLAAYGVLFVGKYLVFERLFRVAEALRTGRGAGHPAPLSTPAGPAGPLPSASVDGGAHAVEPAVVLSAASIDAGTAMPAPVGSGVSVPVVAADPVRWRSSRPADAHGWAALSPLGGLGSLDATAVEPSVSGSSPRGSIAEGQVVAVSSGDPRGPVVPVWPDAADRTL